MARKAVLKLDVNDEKDKKKAMKIVSGFAGIDSISMSMRDGKLTVTGAFDPIRLVEKLRKVFDTHIESVGPAKKANKQLKISVDYPPRLPPSLYNDNHRCIEEDPNGCAIC